MKSNQTNQPERFDYVPVENLEKGQTVVNLGIIKQILPHANQTAFQIQFNPARNRKESSYWYQKGDKLMIA
jgi:hypothetical protein